MRKTFVLDTNVLLHDPQAVNRFEDNQVVIPIEVVEEIDRFKRDPSEKGRNARQVSRLLDQLREKGNLAEGVPIDGSSGGTLKVVFCRSETLRQLPPELKAGNGDNNILAVALEQRLQEVVGGQAPVVLVTKDTNLRIKADAVGLIAQDYTTDKVDMADLYPGFSERWMGAELMDQVKAGEGLSADAIPSQPIPVSPLQANEGVTLVDLAQPAHTLLARYNGRTGNLQPLQKSAKARMGRIQPRNREQAFALDLLLDPAVALVTLVGKAGTGKTLLALAAGLHQVADEHLYERLLVTRPVISLGKEMGFLPGDLEEKMAPWMQPIVDNLDFLLGGEDTQPARGSHRPPRSNWSDLKGMGLLEVEAISYIRGRSIPRQFMVVDEAQNLTPHEVKTIVTRVGEGTKIVLTGDPYQIDNPYVDAESNGLTWLVERFKGQLLSGHITLMRGERSELAELAANLL
ncbi:PhoH family protein [Synechococcus sp. BA-132 BA5]|uniref:PhoH family protein n=1 Tax=Synechococcus sp. BA-132 BA5 TaxID=3110252 RepID=UPI002B1F79A1|nr:PhoH family protein [Synechococcus sp. BA-132 BA5]MEA5414496.1 PhoH family protein [Synechococcus sp. BA-132 BA5]